MKNLQHLCAATILTVVLAISAVAHEASGTTDDPPPCPPPTTTGIIHTGSIERVPEPPVTRCPNNTEPAATKPSMTANWQFILMLLRLFFRG